MTHGENSERQERRQRLATAPNPAPHYDALVRWSGALSDGRVLTLEFVPDRLLLAPEAFAGYLKGLEAASWATLEALVLAVLDDLNNQLVPRWVRVGGSLERGGIRHHATANDRQPDWNNPGLLSAPD